MAWAAVKPPPHLPHRRGVPTIPSGPLGRPLGNPSSPWGVPPLDRRLFRHLLLSQGEPAVPRIHPRTPAPLRTSPTLTLGLLLIALISRPGGVHAQAPEQGTWSVGLPLFTENVGSVLNAGFMATSRLHVGLEVNLQAAEVEQDVNRPTLGFNSKVETKDFAFGPVLKWYGSGVGPVTPFLRLRGLIGWGSEQITIEGQPFRETDTSILAAALAIGAEWFPIRQLSLSGHTGFDYTHQTLERLDFDGDLIERTGTNFGTFRSALTVTFYFR